MNQDERFVPFGAQYYRAPTPAPEQWPGDLENMARLGFNTIKIWAQWRWNQPSQDEYDFADLDRLMDLAEKNGLKVVINTIFDVAPVWFWELYPEAAMLTNDGRRVGPTTTACRQIGGAPGPCLHHPAAAPGIDAFLAQTVRRYAGHPALLAWDLWNEPELTCGLARDPRPENLVCYCRHTIEAFRFWLGRKYGDLPVLNRIWGRNYRSWNEVEAPRDPGAIGDMLDWRRFFVETISGEMARRAKVARAADGTHPIMCHTVPPPVFDPVSCGSDDWELARCCDWFGNSTAGNPFTTDVAVAAAGGRRVINAEIHALPGGTMNPPHPPEKSDLDSFILAPLARGVSGFIFWQYRPELLGLEAPAWGLTREDGSCTPWLTYAAELNRVLQEHASLVAEGRPLPPEVGILIHPHAQILTWCARGDFELYHGSVQGAHALFYRANHRVRLLHPADLREGLSESLRLVYLPFPYALDAETAGRLRRWTEAGGTLVAEAGFGRYCPETNRHADTMPGYGFTEVFGAREIGMIVDRRVPIRLRPEPGADQAWQTEGAEFAVPLAPDRALILARFEDGGAAAVQAAYGCGTAVLIGTCPGLAYYRSGAQGPSPLAATLASLAGVSPAVRAEGPLRADVLLDGDRCLLIVENLSGAETQGKVHVDLPGRWRAVALTGEAVSLPGEGLNLSLTLVPKAFCLALGRADR